MWLQLQIVQVFNTCYCKHNAEEFLILLILTKYIHCTRSYRPDHNSDRQRDVLGAPGPGSTSDTASFGPGEES